MSTAIARAWRFASQSNPNVAYETLLLVDGSTSCGCPGWTRRVAADGSRSCRHTRLVHMDLEAADAECESMWDYTKMINVMDGHFIPTPTTKQPTKGKRDGKENKTAGPEFGKFGRKIVK